MFPVHLNGIAAKWAKENIEIDNVNLRQGEVEINFIDKKSNE